MDGAAIQFFYDHLPLWAFVVLMVVIAGFFTHKFWSKSKRVQKVKRTLTQEKLPPATEFTVAMTHLANDEKDVVRQQLMHALESLPLEVSGFDRLPEFNNEVAQKEHQRKLHVQARAWLKESHTDLMIWGKVIPARGDKEQRVQLYFTAKDSDDQQHKVFNESEFVELSTQAKDALEAMICIQVLTRMASFSDAHPIAQALKDEVARFKRMANEWPAGETRATLQFALGNALQKIGNQLGNASALKEAITAYQDALGHWTQKTSPLNWAMTQNNLGNVLRSLGERESGTEKLNEAVAAYREALKKRTRERVPLDWAMTQNNLGNALSSLGERESGTEKLNDAVAAHREALKEYTREQAPLNWATTQNNLGAALQTLGEREGSAQKLNEAVTAYREALKEYTRERVPLDWAMTQNNLGNALGSLGERESGTEKLNEAVAAYREALKERTRERVPLQWATTQNNLGSALSSLGKRESGTEKLNESVAAYREALKEWTRERAPLQWATTQNNLGIALRSLGVREGGTKRLEQAVVAYREALEEWTRERVPLDWAMTQNNLGTVLKALGEQDISEAGLPFLRDARAAYEQALEVFEGAATHYVEVVQGNLKKLKALIQQRGGA